VVLGGLVFLELSRDYLREWGGNWREKAPQRLVYLDAFQDEMPADRGRIVILSQVLPSPRTIGYEHLENLVVSRVNGREIKSLEDLAAAAGQPGNGFQRIDFEEDPKTIFLDSQVVQDSNAELMEQYGLPALQRL
jgi:hypothetical protein